MYRTESSVILCYVLKGQSKRWDIQLDISAPRFLIPESFQDKKASVVSIKVLSRVNRVDCIIVINPSVSLSTGLAIDMLILSTTIWLQACQLEARLVLVTFVCLEIS